MQECPIGTYKNVSGSDRSLCAKCPSHELPHRALYIPTRGTFSLILWFSDDFILHFWQLISFSVQLIDTFLTGR